MLYCTMMLHDSFNLLRKECGHKIMYSWVIDRHFESGYFIYHRDVHGVVFGDL